MKKINLNEIAREITALEGKKVQVNIGQVKEILKIVLMLLRELFENDPVATMELIFRKS